MKTIIIDIDQEIAVSDLATILKDKGFQIEEGMLTDLPLNHNNKIFDIYVIVDNESIDWIDEYELRDIEEEEDREKIILLSDFGETKNKEKISDINIFSLREGGYAIRCRINGVQQSATKMSKEDANTLSEKTDRTELAYKYFQNEINDNRGINKGVKL